MYTNAKLRSPFHFVCIPFLMNAIFQPEKVKYTRRPIVSTLCTLAFRSAGGTGVMLNVDAVQDLVRGPLGMPHVSVRGLVDSGWFLDRAPFSPDGPHGPNRPNALSASDAVRQGMALWRARMPTACAAHYRAEPWRCYFGYRLYPTIRGTLAGE